LMSAVFRTPDMSQLKLGHAVLEEMNSRSPAAAVTAARRHLESHPDDPHVLRELASALEKLGDHDDESRVLVRLFAVEPSVEPLRRLGELNRLGLLPTLERLKLAEKYGDDQDVARELLQSVVDGDDDIQRPEAMLALAGLEREDHAEKATEILNKLCAKYPLHPTVDLARARGWLA
jgi:hypothetical protein